MTDDRPQNDPRRCHVCGFANLGFASFCISCGEPLDSGESPVVSSDSSTSPESGDSGVTRSPLDTRNSQLARWETWIGLAVLVLVVGYALYSWQQTNAKSDAYREGVVAEQRLDWDKAHESFARAGDWRDAARRGEAARLKVTQRNQLYSAAVEAERLGNLDLALSDLVSMQSIQPSFQDSGIRLSRIRDEVLKGDFKDIVYLVQDGPAPGLRVPDAQANPHILPGSDRRSLVRAVSADGHSLVYDRPPQPQEATRSQIGNARTLALARLGTGGVITTTSLEGLDPNGNGVLNDNGLWWYSSPTPSGLLGYEVFYVDLASNQVTQVSDLSAGKRVLAVDPARSQVIIAQGVGEQTILWLADPTGMVETSLRLVTGDVTEASISDDGQWLLYITQQNGDEITTTVYVLPLAHDKLRQWMRDSEKGRLQALNWSDVPLSAHISATFLPSQGQGHTQAIVNRSEGNVESIEVYNLDNGGTDFVWRSQTDGTRLADTAGLSADGGYLVYRRQLGNNASLELLDLQAKGVGWSDTGLPAGADQLARVQIAPRADYVIASLLNPEGMDRGISQALYSIPIEAGSRLGEATLIARPDLPNTQELPTVAVPSGGHVLAYTTPGKELHAVFFDGTGDKVLAKHVAAVWSLGADKALSWWR